MARISGVDLPNDKRIPVALTYIYGIGPTRAQAIVTGCALNSETRARSPIPTISASAINAKLGVVRATV